MSNGPARKCSSTISPAASSVASFRSPASTTPAASSACSDRIGTPLRGSAHANESFCNRTKTDVDHGDTESRERQSGFNSRTDGAARQHRQVQDPLLAALSIGCIHKLLGELRVSAVLLFMSNRCCLLCIAADRLC